MIVIVAFVLYQLLGNGAQHSTSLVANEGVTVFLNTHNLAEAEKLRAR